MRLVVLGIVAGLVCASCARNVSQDRSTGPDGDIAGAVAMQLASTDDVATLGREIATATGIVTYPGGDRVDWKLLDLPELGSIDVELSWRSPRPGMRLAVDAVDADHRVLARARPRLSPTHLHVDGARGRIYFRVYAAGRGDAGRYQLAVTFARTPPVDWLALEIPGPPDLPAVPEVRPVLDPGSEHCDWTRPGIPGCGDSKCPMPPDVENPACWPTMPCPNPPDRRIKACHPTPPWDCEHPTPDIPLDACRNWPPSPIVGRIINTQLSGSDTLVTIGRGSKDHIDRTWRADVLRGDTKEPLAGGEVVIIRVDKLVTIGKVRLTLDAIHDNPHVQLSRPRP